MAVDNCSNALFLALTCIGVKGMEITIPSHTYMSVPCEIINAGAKVKWKESSPWLEGEYQLEPTNVWDSALCFSRAMYREGQMQCISFTGAFKHLKLGKGGAILLDNEKHYEWLKRARNSGRGECSYHVDNFTSIGRNCYLMPEIAVRGLLLIQQFYTTDGVRKYNADLCLKYPDLSKFPIYTQNQ